MIHISEAEAASDFASLMARVRSGAEVVIEDNARPVAVVRPAEPHAPVVIGISSPCPRTWLDSGHGC